MYFTGRADSGLTQRLDWTSCGAALRLNVRPSMCQVSLGSTASARAVLTVLGPLRPIEFLGTPRGVFKEMGSQYKFSYHM